MPAEEEKVVNDGINGFVRLSKTEVDLIDSEIFQRLHWIRQNGVANLVFPGAVHDRFSHSIGTLYFADRIYRHVFHDAQDENELKLIRAAALLHDVGHYPLSHTIEASYLELLTDSAEDAGIGPPAMDPFVPFVPRARRGKDSYMSALVILKTDIRQILEQHNIDPTAVAQIVVGHHPKVAFNQIITSEIDADRLDYLARDSKYFGVPYGNVGAEALIRSMRFMPRDGIIAIDRRGRLAIEHFIMARYFMYSEVLYHKAVAGFNYLAKEIWKGLIQRGMVYTLNQLMQIITDPSRQGDFVGFTDRMFWDLLERIRKNPGILLESDDANADIKNAQLLEFIEMLVARKPLKQVKVASDLLVRREPSRVDQRITLLESITQGRQLERLAQDSGVPREWIIPIKTTTPTTRYAPFELAQEPGDISTIYYSEDGEEFSALGDDPTSLLFHLGSLELIIFRIYTKEAYEMRLKEAIEQAIGD